MFIETLGQISIHSKILINRYFSVPCYFPMRISNVRVISNVRNAKNVFTIAISGQRNSSYRLEFQVDSSRGTIGRWISQSVGKRRVRSSRSADARQLSVGRGTWNYGCDVRGERHKLLGGRLLSGLANWFPAARLDYANRIYAC